MLKQAINYKGKKGKKKKKIKTYPEDWEVDDPKASDTNTKGLSTTKVLLRAAVRSVFSLLSGFLIRRKKIYTKSIVSLSNKKWFTFRLTPKNVINGIVD